MPPLAVSGQSLVKAELTTLMTMQRNGGNRDGFIHRNMSDSFFK